MKGRKYCYISISGDAILEMIKEKFDIPKDSSLVKISIDPPIGEFVDRINMARVLIEHKDFEPLFDRYHTPRFSVESPLFDSEDGKKYEVNTYGTICLKGEDK